MAALAVAPSGPRTKPHSSRLGALIYLCFTVPCCVRGQGVVVQPIGEAGVLVAATDTVRGFSQLDQAWLATIADKLDATLEGPAAESAAAAGGRAAGAPLQ